MNYYVHIAKQGYSYPVTATGKTSKKIRLKELIYSVIEFDTFEKAYKQWSTHDRNINIGTVTTAIITNTDKKLTIKKNKIYQQHTGRESISLYFSYPETKHELEWSYIETEVAYGLQEEYKTTFITDNEEARAEADHFVELFYDKRQQLNWTFKKVKWDYNR